MIQITNISDTRFSMSTSSGAGRGSPLAVNLAPKSKHPNWLQLTNTQLHNWPVAAKMQLADGVAMGLIRVDVLGSVHDAHDRRPMLTMGATANDLNSAIAASTTFKGFFNFHAANTAWHTAAGVTLVTAADPTTWATVYALITDAQAQYTAHIAAAIHPNADTVNVLVLGAPATPEQAVAALGELYVRLGLHKMAVIPSVAAPLTPAAITAY